MNKGIEHALLVLGIRQPPTLYDLSPGDIARLRMYLRAHGKPLGEVLLHNDAPAVEGGASWGAMNKLLFRGSRASWDVLADGFNAVPDGRFDKPVIIRDRWADKNVRSHMQTKAVLAWSKSFYVALEYAFGCIAGGLDNPVHGYLHFCWAEQGIDVVDAVRQWERESLELVGRMDPGQQHEVLTPALPRNRILATWKLSKRQGIGGTEFVLSEIAEHEGNFAAVMPLYREIADRFEVGQTYDYVAKGNEVDRFVLL